MSTSRRAGAREKQFLAVDAGNTNTVFGVYRGDTLVTSLRLSTERERTADELAAGLLPLLAIRGFDPLATDTMLVSSVVPPLNQALIGLARQYFEVEPRFVSSDLETGLPIRYELPAEVGADRIVNAVAARAHYGAPVVVVDFGTATTFDIVDEDGAYAGGIIAPGLMISAEALFSRASRLYRVDIRRPDRLIGRDTGSAMQAGIYYGYVGQVDGILARLVAERPGLQAIVATGGLAPLIAEGSTYIKDVRPQLTLEGLKLIHDQLED